MKKIAKTSMQVVILAGGLGTRLRPLTDSIPKVMVLVQDKPFLEYILKLLKKNNFKKLVLCVGYLGNKIENYFGNGENWGLNIKYSFDSFEKEKLLGTGGALKSAQQYLADEFLLINGDTYLPIDYLDLIQYFQKKNKMGVIAVYKNPRKTLQSKKFIHAGAGVYKKEMVVKLIPKDKKVSLEKDVFPKLINQNQLGTYIAKEKFYDIGTAERLKIIKKILK